MLLRSPGSISEPGPLWSANPLVPSRSQGPAEAASQYAPESFNALSGHVQDLLVDAHRQRRVRVAEQVHRPPRRHTDLGKDRGEGPPQRVRSHVADWWRSALDKQLVGALANRREEPRADVVRVLPRAAARWKRRTSAGFPLGARGQQGLMQSGHHRDSSLRRVRLHARPPGRPPPPSRQLNMLLDGTPFGWAPDR